MAGDLDDRIAKLPAWLQRHISDLESRIRAQEKELETLRASMAVGPEDSDVFAEVGDVERPLGKGASIDFRRDGYSYTVVLRADGRLRIESTEDLVLEPSTPYEVFVHLKGKGPGPAQVDGGPPAR